MAAATFGYGAVSRPRARCGSRELDREEIGGSLTLLGRIESIEPVATQGPA